MRKTSLPRVLGAAGIVLALLPPCGPSAGRASPRIDTAHTARDRRNADACIISGVVIYTDPYIGGRLSNAEIVGRIARMCAQAFRIYAEDRGLDAADADRVLRQTIEAGLRGQFRETAAGAGARDAR